MRSFEEIKAEVEKSMSLGERTRLRSLARELSAFGTPESSALMLLTTGAAEWLAGEYTLALEQYEDSLEAFENLNDRDGQAKAYIGIGNVLKSTGEYSSALEQYRRAVRIREELGDRNGVATVIGNLGIVFANTGDYATALEHYRRAMKVHEEVGDQIGVARVTGNIGNVFMIIGDLPSAKHHLQQALQAYEELGDCNGVARVTLSIGNLYAETNDYSSAQEHWQRAQQLYDELGDRTGLARVFGSMGLIPRSNGDYALALEHYNRALKLHERLGNRADASIVTGDLIAVLLDSESLDEAEALLTRQSNMKADDPRVRSLYYRQYAHLLKARSDLDGAWDHLKQALQISEGAGSRPQTAVCHLELRELAAQRSVLDSYVHHNMEYLRIIEEINGAKATQRMAVMEAEKKMAAERQEREKERALLYGALPEHIATRILRGETIEDHFENAAVLFADIAGFTTHTSSMHPSDTIKLLEDLYKTFDAICEEYGVTKVKTIGDSYLAFAGAPLAASTEQRAQSPAERIAAVALAMQNADFYWPSATANSNSNRIQLRIGIHSGPLSAGVIGTQRLQYDIWGDTVNVASRMESTGEAGRIQVSESFARALSLVPSASTVNDPAPGNRHQTSDIGKEATEASRFPISDPRYPRLTERGEVNVKGKGPMITYWLVSE